MRQPLVIYGAGWPDVVKIVDEINRVRARWLVLGFLDDTASKRDSTFMGYPILGGVEALRDLGEKGALFVNNVYSSTANRRLIANALLAANCQLATLVYPSVNANRVQVGSGTVVSDGAVLGANVAIGSQCAVRSNATVTHDTVLGDYVFVGPGATLCGHLKVGSGAYLGAGCTILPGLEIGRDSVVGAGAVVTRNVAPGAVVTGNPAHPARGLL